MKNKTVIRIIADDWRDYNRSYGNIKIDFEDCSVEIENDYRNVSYFGVNEELAGYDVICLKNENFESSVMSDNLYVKKFNKKITGISIIRDTVMIDYSSNIKRENERRSYFHSQWRKYHPCTKKRRSSSASAFKMVTQEGFEPPTHRLEGGCSIQLSY